MTRMLIALAAMATTMGSLATVDASTLPLFRGRAAAAAQNSGPRILSTTAAGKPILLARMVVTATPLDE